MNQLTLNNCYQLGNYVSDILALKVYQKACEPGEVQNQARAFIRSSVGIASFRFFPYAGIVGIAAQTLTPSITKKCSTIAEGLINGALTKISFKTFLVASSVGLIAVACYDPVNFFTIMGSGIAVKLGAELCDRNNKKEIIAATTREAELKANLDN